MKNLMGGWEIASMEACKLPEDVAAGFSSISHLLGASYIPVLYGGRQLVNGWNHMLICKQELSAREPEEHLVEMMLHQDRSENSVAGEFCILNIKPVI